ncbi:hypothetical protein MDV086.2 [Gallid alphaherpesvirus 2]|nr:hypothetical protein MDV086.2 [Gallid alphaherpesvirus 2]
MGPPPPKKKGTVPSSAQIGAPRGLGVRGAERGKRVRFRGYENSCVFSPCISYRPFLGRGIFLLAKSYSWKFDKTCQTDTVQAKLEKKGGGGRIFCRTGRTSQGRGKIHIIFC